jgi:mycoredoxin
MEKIKIYGTRWCGDCKRAMRILDEHQVDYNWIDIDQNKDGEAFVKTTNQGNRSVPTIIFPDGSILVEPPNQKLIDKLNSFGF